MGAGGWFDFCPQSKVASVAQTKSITLPIYTGVQDAGLPQTTEVSEERILSLGKWIKQDTSICKGESEMSAEKKKKIKWVYLDLNSEHLEIEELDIYCKQK